MRGGHHHRRLLHAPLRRHRLLHVQRSPTEPQPGQDVVAVRVLPADQADSAGQLQRGRVREGIVDTGALKHGSNLLVGMLGVPLLLFLLPSSSLRRTMRPSPSPSLPLPRPPPLPPPRPPRPPRPSSASCIERPRSPPPPPPRWQMKGPSPRPLHLLPRPPPHSMP